MTVKFEVAYSEGTTVYFTFSQEIPYIVRAYEYSTSRGTKYILYNPEVGEAEAYEEELTTERSIY